MIIHDPRIKVIGFKFPIAFFFLLHLWISVL